MAQWRAVLVGVLGIWACACGSGGSGGGGSGGTGSIAPIDFDTPVVPPAHLVIIQPSARDGFVTDQPSLELSGVVSDASQFEKLWWESNAASGDLKVTDDAWITASIALSPGDTRFTVSGQRSDGSVVSDALNVTLNTSAAFTAPLWADPPYVFAGESTEFTFHVGLDAAVTTATVIKTDEHGNPDGDLAPLALNGLEWTATTSLALSEPGATYVRVRAETSAGPALSEVIALTALLRPEQAQLDELEALMKESEDVYDKALATSGDDREARTQLFAFMSHQPSVVQADPGPKGEYFHFVHETGVQLARSFAPPDVKGNPHVRSTQAIANEQGVVKLRKANAELADSIEPKVRAQRCPRFDYTNNSVAQVKDYRDLAAYGLIVISAHGYSGGTEKFPQRDLIWTDQEASAGDIFREGDPLILDIIAGSVAVELSAPYRYLITPKLIRSYVHGMPDSIVFNGTCHSARSGDMAKAFLGAGAAAYIGFTSGSDALWVANHARGFFDQIMDGASAKDAFTFIVNEFGFDDPNPKNFGTTILPYYRIPDIHATGVCMGTTELEFEQTNAAGTQKSTVLSQDKLAHMPLQGEFRLVERTISCEVHDLSVDASAGLDGTGSSHETYELKDDRTKFFLPPGLAPLWTLDPEYKAPNWVDFTAFDAINGTNKYKGGCPWYGAGLTTPFLEPTELTEQGITVDRGLGGLPGISGYLKMNYEFATAFE